MAINEIFPNPTVKQVIFQIRFHPIFYLENKIGDFQIAIREQFPESSLIIKKTLGIAENQKPEENIFPPGKIWQFKSVRGDILNVEFNSLAIVSDNYKTYQLGDGDKFRDLIQLVSDKFIDIMKIPIIKRIGLRYIDECPFPSRNQTTFKRYYNTTLPLGRFNLQDIAESYVNVVVKKDNCNLRYLEKIIPDEGKDKFVLDFDGFATDIDSHDYLNITDKLHTIIDDEYEKTLKKPVLDIMRQKR
nr:TIGR04255 family protein [uncultured Methanoregula sp.]